MTYNQQDIELMISNLPKHRALSDLDESFTPQRRHLKAGGQHLPIPTRPRKIINSMIEYFQDNPVELENNWSDSNIPYFLWDVQKFSEDRDVKRLIQIPNVKNLIKIQNRIT
ncbi:hypothetical protein [Candidatus Nitrosarchaeum limnium]|uniref:Uncharacterized protein n=1 Tax=Candidatus Nitrosarchaeum limnium BG20 TaxID=859192 RepID=S2E4F6_9ARCH|nr:hypothetical protein [Candidatus Nitrosarchaeum limnium]EPA06075.1 hypothetical protein BG20_I1811 [Candidatus Nitrosarchaeum limnium BG20]